VDGYIPLFLQNIESWRASVENELPPMTVATVASHSYALTTRPDLTHRKLAGLGQRKGMGLPCMAKLLTDGCVHLLHNSSYLEVPLALRWAVSVRATGTVRKRQAVRTVHHIPNHICWVTLL